MYKIFFKRCFDIVFSFLGLLLLCPVFLIVTLALLVANDGKPFFFQLRPGKNARIFKIIKFKTMNDKKDADGKLLPDAVRLTKAGAFIRRTSLDEIPQLINVLKGDMSFIGPRPLLIEYLPVYTQREQLRHTVRPGITGLAQVNGRNHLGWDDRLEMDARYVETLSAKNDFRIMIKTIENVIRRKDVIIIPGEKFGKLDYHRNGNKG